MEPHETSFGNAANARPLPVAIFIGAGAAAPIGRRRLRVGRTHAEEEAPEGTDHKAQTNATTNKKARKAKARPEDKHKQKFVVRV
eukprot:6400316-Pyramimonas_sp.AAC.1